MKNLTKILVAIYVAIMMIAVACKKDDPTPTTPVTPTTTPPVVTKSAAKDITKFSFAALSPAVDATIDASTKAITATVPAATDVTKLVPTINISDKATVSPASGVAQDFSKEVSYTVTAEDASTVVYKVNVTKATASGISGVVPSTEQVIYTDKNVNKSSIISKSIVAIDAISGKELSSWELGTEALTNPPKYTTTDLGDGKDNPEAIFFENGMLYTTTLSKIEGRDAFTGKVKWSFNSSEVSDPVIENGTLFIHKVNGGYFIYALDAATGAKKWEFAMNPNLSSQGVNTLTVSNGLLYAGTDAGLVVLETATGKEKWRASNGLRVIANPAIVNGIIYYGEVNSGSFFALDAITGTKKWEFKAGGRIVYSSPTISEGIVYFGSDDKKMYALDATSGTKKWEFLVNNGTEIYSPFADNDNLYFAEYNSKTLYALDKKTGTKKWSITSDAIRPDILDVVVINGILYEFNTAYDAQTGTKKWSITDADFDAIVIKNKYYPGGRSGMQQ